MRGDPLGLFERAHRRDDPVDLFVHPRTVLFDGQSLGYLRDLEGLPAADLSRDDVSFHALLEYQPGDDLRHVHWRSTARTGTMMVRQYEETRRSHFVIGLSRSLADYATEDDFELGVSAAGSIGLRALRDSQRVDMRVQGRELPAGTGKQLLDSLSAVENSKPKEGGIAELAGVVSATMPLASVVVLVCGARVKSDDLRLACARLPFGARVLVVVADTTASAPALRRIGDADVVTVGALEQIPLALQKVARMTASSAAFGESFPCAAGSSTLTATALLVPHSRSSASGPRSPVGPSCPPSPAASWAASRSRSSRPGAAGES